MQLTKNVRIFDARTVEHILTTQDKYVADLFCILSLPNRNVVTNEEEQENSSYTIKMKEHSTTRAKSLTELQHRLQIITSKKKLTYKEKLSKKNLKSKMKKKTKQNERSGQQKLHLQRGAEAKVNSEMTDRGSGDIKTANSIFNSGGKMFFSKFNFVNLGVEKAKKQGKDAKKILKKLEREKTQLNELKEAGEIGKVIELTHKKAWKHALVKAQGEKVKDDPVLLKKTVQKQEQKKRSSKKKWQIRQERVEKGKQERQLRRNENIEKRKKETMKNKLKRVAKTGKIIPGF